MKTALYRKVELLSKTNLRSDEKDSKSMMIYEYKLQVAVRLELALLTPRSDVNCLSDGAPFKRVRSRKLDEIANLLRRVGLYVNAQKSGSLLTFVVDTLGRLYGQAFPGALRSVYASLYPNLEIPASFGEDISLKEKGVKAKTGVAREKSAEVAGNLDAATNVDGAPSNDIMRRDYDAALAAGRADQTALDAPLLHENPPEDLYNPLAVRRTIGNHFVEGGKMNRRQIKRRCSKSKSNRTDTGKRKLRKTSGSAGAGYKGSDLDDSLVGGRGKRRHRSPPDVIGEPESASYEENNSQSVIEETPMRPRALPAKERCSNQRGGSARVSRKLSLFG